MQSELIGHTWKRRPDLCPAIVGAFEITGSYQYRLSKINVPYWVVDYEFASYGRFRTRFFRGPWRARRARTVHLYPPEVVFWEDDRDEEGQRHSAWMLFTGGDQVGLRHLLHPTHEHAEIADPDQVFGSFFRDAARIGHRSGENGFWQAQAVLCRIIDSLKRTQPKGPGQFQTSRPLADATKSELAREVEEFLRTHLAERISLRDIALALHVSESSLSHRLRAESGQTPIGMLARLRINHAKALLLKGLPLKVIADQLGFSDAFHLSKTFKRVEGVSPRGFVDSR